MFSFKLIARLLAYLSINPRRILHAYAVSQLGKTKAGIPDTAPNVVNCVEALNQIGWECFDAPFCVGASTITLNAILRQSPRYKAVTVDEAKPGDIIVDPTQGAKTGHCGILGENGIIMSNQSSTGLWLDHWTLEKWVAYYEKKLGLQTFFYRILY